MWSQVVQEEGVGVATGRWLSEALETNPNESHKCF